MFQLWLSCQVPAELQPLTPIFKSLCPPTAPQLHIPGSKVLEKVLPQSPTPPTLLEVLRDHLEEAVSTATASQGLAAGRDHVLLLLRHPQWKLGEQQTNWSAEQRPAGGAGTHNPTSKHSPQGLIYLFFVLNNKQQTCKNKSVKSLIFLSGVLEAPGCPGQPLDSPDQERSR